MRVAHGLNVKGFNHGYFLVFAAITAMFTCGELRPTGASEDRQPRSETRAALSLNHQPIAVFPLHNATANPELNWLSIGLQESITADLFCISELNTRTLSDLNPLIGKRCPDMRLSCVTGLNTNSNAGREPFTLSDWKEIASTSGLGQFIWGSYHQNGEGIEVQLSLYNGPQWMPATTLTIRAAIDGLLRETSGKLVVFLQSRGLSVNADEVARIMTSKTQSVDAWQNNAMGFWMQQLYMAAGAEEKKTVAAQRESYYRKALAFDPLYAEAWANLGHGMILSGNPGGAAESFQKALARKPELISARLGYGYCLAEQGNLPDAVSQLEAALKLNPSLSKYYDYLMGTYRNAGLWNEGLAMLDRLEPFLKERNRENERMDLLWWRALFLHELKQFAASKEAYSELLSFKERTLGPEHPGVALIVTNLAFVCTSLGEYTAAEQFLKRALSIGETVYGPDDPRVAIRLTNLAQLYHTLGKYQQAKPLYERALAIDEKAQGGQHPGVARDASNLASLYYAMGNFAEAQTLYERALSIDEAAYGSEHPEVAGDLANLAGVHYALGKYAKAKLLYERALAIDETAYGSEHPEVGRDLNNLASIYRVLGSPEKARSLYEQALLISRKAHGQEHPTVANVLNNLGELCRERGEYSEAQSFYDEALRMYQKLYGPNHPDVATVVNNLAGLAFASGNYAKAKSLYEQALSIDESIYGEEQPHLPVRLNNLAEIYAALDQYDRAEQLYKQALADAQAGVRPELLWRIQLNLGCLLVKRKNPAAAIFFGKQAVNSIQGMRADLASIEKELQTSFLQSKWHAYRFLADLLIDYGRLPEAQQVLAMQKEEEYFDFLCRDAGRRDVRSTKAGYSDEELSLSERYGEISQQIASLGREFAELKQKRKIGLSEPELKRYLEVSEDLKVARQRFNSYLATLIDGLSTVSLERYAEIKAKRLDKPRKLQQALEELGHGAVLIHYLVMENKLHIILTTTEAQLARTSTISSTELNHKIMDFRTTVQSPSRTPLPLAQELYQIIIGPIEQDLQQAGAQTLMLSLDGALRYLPIAALHDGQGFLIERYRLALYTAAAEMDIKDVSAGRWMVGGFGLSHGVGDFDPLPHVPAELEAIVRKDASDEDGVLPGVIYLDEAFSEEAIESVLLQEYPVVHIASHFELKPGTKEDSHLVLGDGTTITLAKIKEDNYDFGEVEMLTLSACNTAIGNTGADGSELESFGTLAQDQGAKGVLATLWPVVDRSTGLLMQHFYRLHADQPHMTKAEALRQAQLAFIQGETEGGETPGDKTRGMRVSKVNEEKGKEGLLNPDGKTSYSHPFFWAPFILMGNWL